MDPIRPISRSADPCWMGCKRCSVVILCWPIFFSKLLRSDRCVEVICSTDQHFQVLQLVSALKFAYNYLQLSIYEGRIFFERKYITTVNSSCPEYKVYTTTAVLSVILQQSTSNCYHGRTQSEFSTHRANISRVLRCHLT